jgi:hypothetical protein
VGRASVSARVPETLRKQIRQSSSPGRDTAASQTFADGERVEEVAWLVRHASANTTRSVYLHEIRDAEVNAQRRLESRPLRRPLLLDEDDVE